MRDKLNLTTLALSAFLLLAGTSAPLMAGQPMPGAVFTTNVACGGVDLNLYTNTVDVYLNGGPHSDKANAAGLTDGLYFVQVTSPEGDLLGSSLTTTPVQVLNGSFVQCYQLWSIVWSAANPSAKGFDVTPNNGGEYKVWVSSVASFDNSLTKTDNFKVKPVVVPPPPPAPTKLEIRKFYDANANGIQDPGEPTLTPWKVNYTSDQLTYTVAFTNVSVDVAPGTYYAHEFMPIQANWLPTTDVDQMAIIAPNTTVGISFGNVCIGAGGGLTLGFWSNKNGQALVNPSALTLLTGLNLRNANGTAFDPATYAALRIWLLNGTATNMCYMLSVQLAAMELNVFTGKVGASSIIYAPGVASANSYGFTNVSSLMTEANNQLSSNTLVLSGNPVRAYLEALKNALDNANNNLTFVQAAPGPFSF